MKVLFQTIGVLIQYNWALPYSMVKLDHDFKVFLATDIFSYLMGGFYYQLRQPVKLIPVIVGSGVFPSLDKILENISPRNLPDKGLVHLNKNIVKSKLTARILKIDVPKIFTFHGSLDYPHVRDIARASNELKEINKNVDAFVAVSEHSAKTIEENCSFKPIVIHNGIDISIFNPFRISKQKARRMLSIPEHKKVILWFGRIDPDKGLHLFIKALPYIIRNCKNVIVIAKGRTINRTYLKSMKILSARLGVSKHLEFVLGWTPNINCCYYYRASDVYVHTSFSEGFSLTLIEAMASGVPVVGNNVSSIPEAIGDCGLLFDGSEEDLADKVLRLLHDSRLATKVGMRGFKRVLEKGFTVEDAAKKYVSLYLSLT